MKKQNTLYAFYAKCGALALPFLLLIAFYVYEDPFMVIRSYNDYDHCPVEQSEGDIGWKKMLHNRASQRYDSFIMGSSCTKAYNTEEWKDRKSTRLNSSHANISYAVFCLKK